MNFIVSIFRHGQVNKKCGRTLRYTYKNQLISEDSLLLLVPFIIKKRPYC